MYKGQLIKKLNENDLNDNKNRLFDLVNWIQSIYTFPSLQRLM